jgi:F0F1-type ATP synthase membrane subunit a
MATIPPGPHPITLKITYSDDLKVQHQLLVNSSVDFKTKQSQSARAGNGDGSLFATIIAGINNNIMFFVIIVAVIILAIFLIKKRKSKSKKTKFNSSSEMESFLDDISSTNANTSEDLLNEELKRNKITGKKGGIGGNK